jgi:hypothetical protein
MRLYSLVACAVVPSLVCSCGSSSPPAGPSDASMDAPKMDAGPPEGSPLDAPTSDGPPTDAPVDAPFDAPGVISSACDNAGLLAGCVVGACTVSATGKPLADGVAITLTQKPVPADLNGDTLGSVLCSIGVTADAGAGDAVAQAVPNLSLSIGLTSAADASATLFQYMSPSLSRGISTSQASGNAVVGLVTAPGDFGATKRPGPWSLQADIGLDMSSSTDRASLLRNLSSQSIGGAFYDGANLLVCSGPRLLIYKGIPNPGVAPNVVLGQPDLNTASTQTTSSLFGGAACTGVWSDGTRLVVANGNRLLIWNAIPSQNATPADIVLGQPDFSSNTANSGGVGASTLSTVVSIDSDGSRLAAADMRNNRVLLWNQFPTSVDQAADIVIGQPDFVSNAVSNGATPIYQAWGALLAAQGLFLTGQFNPGLVHVATTTANNPAVDFTVLSPSVGIQLPNAAYTPGGITRVPNSGLAVRDAYLNRILMLKTVPTAATSIDFVLGQPDFARTVSSPVSASVLSFAESVGAGQLLLVPDSRRLLVFDATPGFNFEPASRVIGQAGFTTNERVDYRGISASTLAGPADVAAGGGFLAVADRSNNRVLLYSASDIGAQRLAASVVLGQPDATSYVFNAGQQGPTAAGMSGPAGVALDGTHLIVSDTENHRVLIWNSIPSATATPADLVLGQATFTTGRPNRGRGDANADGYSDANADGFFYPIGVASDGTHLFVADRMNNRVLVWNTFPTSNGQAADAVLGQADFTSLRPNRGSGDYTFVGNGFNLPTGVTLIGTTLWVADTENNRVVRWDNVFTSPTAAAFIGQTSGTSVANPNYNVPPSPNVGLPTAPSTTTGSVLRPRGVAVSGGQLFISESDSNRVHIFGATTLTPAGELGQASDTTSTANASGVNATSLSTPLGIAGDGSTLWIADSQNHRVLRFDVTGSLATGAGATLVIGQPTMATNGFNQASTAAGGVTSQPAGVALASGNLYVADTGNHRVLVFPTPISAGQMPMRLYGQLDSMQARPNAGGAPSAKTLSGPHGIFVDTKHLIIADTGNNRVLVFDPNATAMDAQLVLGQQTFADNSANGGGATASTMYVPGGVYSDGVSLWVADTGNHRVLVWRAFPTKSGQAADLVLGQASFADVLPNRGGSAATASSLSFPSGIDVVGGVLYVADTGNNRVVSFSTPPTASGASADGVLGQTDLTSRAAAVVSNDLGHLAGPIALVDDGENLYVTDRDLGRVLVFAVGTITSGGPASNSVGASGGLTMSRPSAIAVERTPFFTSRLYVADTGDNQIAVVGSVSRLSSN